MPLTPAQTLIQGLYQIGAIQFGEFLLKSGQTSTVYLNLRKIISYPTLLRQISEAMWQALQPSKIELVCGVPYTALPIATCMALDHNIPMIMRRKEKKEYGTKQMIEGVFQPGQSCLIIEDVITTGGSILETAQDLEKVGLHITDLIVFIDREQGGRENLSKKYNVHAILTMTGILDYLLHSNLISPSERQCINQFLLARTTS